MKTSDKDMAAAELERTAEERTREAAVWLYDRGCVTAEGVPFVARALLEAERAATEREREACAVIAHERARICEDAADKADDPIEARTEMCAALEASHIAERIRARGKDSQ